VFITIACGAISGFHALIASGTTPKLLTNERDILMIGYGGMLLGILCCNHGDDAATVLIPACFLRSIVRRAWSAMRLSMPLQNFIVGFPSR